MRLAIWILLATLAAGCGDIDPESVVGVVFGDGAQCTGFFITDNRVLTASHCYDESTEEGVTVLYTDVDGNQGVTQGEILWSDDSHDGFALVELDITGTPVTWCKSIIGAKIDIWHFNVDKPGKSGGHVLWKWNNVYWTNAESQGGYSGGPVTKGDCVIGVNQGRTDIDTSYVVVPSMTELGLPLL